MTNGWRKWIGDVTSVMAPLSFASIPVLGMLWMLTPQLPPPGISLVRIGVVLISAVLPLYVAARLRSAAFACNTLGLPLLLLGLFPSAHAAAALVALSDTHFSWLYLTMCLLSAWIAARLRPAAAEALHDILRGLAVVVLVVACGLVYRAYLRPPPYAASVRQAIERLWSPGPLPASTPWRPDVYHLVLDGMGRPDVLEREFGVSVRGPLEELRQLGFAVSPNGRANYVQTQLSLASMLNLGYLDELARAERTSNDRAPLRDLISSARVPAVFKQLDYRIEFIGSGYLSSGAFARADECDCPQLWFADAEFGSLSLSPLWVLFGGIGNRAHYDRSVAVFERFERPRSGAAPRYVFAHVPMPHPPFVLDERGQFTNPSTTVSGADGSFYAGSSEQYKAGYRAQAIFTLSRAVRAAKRILAQAANDGRDVVIIIHGDHGPRLGFDMHNPTSDAGQTVVPILLAIRWPPGGPPTVVPESLVNVYRVLFQNALGADTPPLADRSYVSAFATPYVMIPVPLVSADGR